MTPRRLFYALLATILVLVGAGGYGYYWALGRIHAASADYAQALATQTSAQTELDNLTTLKKQYAREVEPILGQIDNALPRTKNQTVILAQLQSIAATNGLKLTTVSLPAAVGLPSQTSQTVKAGKVLALPITFEIKGSYVQLQSFLTKIENLNRFTNVTNLAAATDASGGTVTYSLNVNAYIQP